MVFYCILDFEATCDGSENFPNEIIEFPSILIDEFFNKISDFKSYCKPLKNSILHQFCIDLTGITQDNIDNAPSFKETLIRHQRWIYENTSNDVIFVTCGKWDLDIQMPKECLKNCIKMPGIYKNYINVKDLFKQLYPTVKNSGMISMLKTLKLELEGRHHSGYDDCVNITKIFIKCQKELNKRHKSI